MQAHCLELWATNITIIDKKWQKAAQLKDSGQMKGAGLCLKIKIGFPLNLSF